MTSVRDHSSASASSYRGTVHGVALVGTILTWPLLFLGGLVTTYRVGMAVPDWPTTFGANMFVYNFMNSSWGVKIEHVHRLYASGVGLACIVLAVWFLAAERRRWLKVLGVAALVAVIAQGVLGGTRVTQNSQELAALHGCVAQAFFGLMVVLCVVTGRRWIEAGPQRPDPGKIRSRALVTAGMFYAQVVLGALVRHFGSHMAVGAHVLVAVMVWAHAAMLAWRIEKLKGEVPELLSSSRVLSVLLVLQIVLGIAALVLLWPLNPALIRVDAMQALIRTGHQANGGLLLASSIVLTLRAFRSFAPGSRAAQVPDKETPMKLEVLT